MDDQTSAPPATLPAALLDEVRRVVAAFAAGGPGRGQPGVAWGVVAGGALVASGGAGTLRVGEDRTPDAGSIFRIASMTKSFTAAALLVLRDAGRLGLDDPVARWVPEVADVPLPTADSPVPTVRHLLTMSGGLPTDDPWGDRQQGLDPDAFAAFLRGGLSYAWVPGTTFEYSNLGYAVLGRVLTAVTGQDYADAVRELVLAPLGLASTVFRAQDADPARLALGYRPAPTAAAAGPSGWEELPFDPYGAFAPMGGLFSSVRDLARWVAGFTDAFPPRDAPQGGHPLGRATRREMQQQHRVVPPRAAMPALDAPPVTRGSGYGFGLLAEHDDRWGTVVGHSGGYPGFGSHMRWHPGSGIGVVVLANSTYAASRPTAARILARLLAGGAGGPTVLPGPGVVRPALRPAAAAGGQVWPATTAAVRAVEGLLRQWDDAAADRLLAGNVDLDEPIAVRRERLAGAVAAVAPDGVLDPDPLLPAVHDSPAHAVWWLRGAAGRLRLEVRLTPHPRPLVQTLAVTAVPHPVGALATAVARLAAQTRHADPRWPADVPLADGIEAAPAVRLLRSAAALAGPCRVGPATGGDGTRATTVRLLGERARLDLAVAVDDAGAVLRVGLGLADDDEG